MNKKKYIPCLLKAVFLLFLLLNITPELLAQLPQYYRQEKKNNEGAILTVNILAGVHLPGGDLADRFGSHSSIGLGMDFISPGDWIMGAQWNFYFGNKVKEDVIANLRSPEGLIFGANGDVATVPLRQRGVYIGGHIGKLLRLNTANRKGLRITAGAGFFQHKIRIQDDPVVQVPQLDKQYEKGYDRLSNGLSFTEFAGYQFLGDFRRLNFIVGFEFSQAFTQNRRNFNYDSRMEDNSPRLDLTFGLRAQWLLPFYLGDKAEEIRY